MTQHQRFNIPAAGKEDLALLESEDFLYDLFTADPALANLILKYEYGRGKLENLRIDRQSFTMVDSTHGQFKAHYDLHEFSLCAAIDYLGKEHMTLRYAIDTANHQIVLTGEYRPERMDEL